MASYFIAVCAAIVVATVILVLALPMSRADEE